MTNNNNKILITIILTIIITLFCNCLYYYAGSFLRLLSFETSHPSKLYHAFEFTSNFLCQDYYAVFMWDRFFTVILLGFFIAKGLSEDFIQNFSVKFSEKTKSENIVFVLVFFVLILIPMLRFDNAALSSYENRYYAKFPALTIKNDETYIQNKGVLVNSDFFSHLTNYVNDRFFARQILVNIHNDIKYKLAIRFPHNNNRVIDKKEKLLYRYALPRVYKKYMKPKKYKNFVKSIYRGLWDFKKYCKKNNAELYILILPEKESVYHPNILINNDDRGILGFFKDIDPNKKLDILFPLKALQHAALNGPPMYFKTDHHLTEDGMFIAYRLLMNKIKKLYPDVKITNKNEYNIVKNTLVNAGLTEPYIIGTTCPAVGLTQQQCKKILGYKYTYYKHKNKENLLIDTIRNDKLYLEKFHFPQASDYKVLLVGNSNIETLSKFLVYSFKDVYKLRLNGPSGIKREEQYKIIKYYSNIIEEYKPDIVIFCIDYDVLKYTPDLANLE